MDAAQYLRKSRVEEGLETDEVLAKHRKALADYAARNDIRIIATYEEVVSGESLYARPEMLRLLRDVEAGSYDAVLCMDLDRLSRGRMHDQGIILDTFRDSGTLIITPEKVYDLRDELDDEMAEFKTFMSRREYKIINKRLRRGLNQAIQDGCYVANAPYGYRSVYVDKRPTLEIYEPEAKFVRMMYQMYADGYGCVSIARQVNLLGARPHRSDAFNRSSVMHILKNPTFAGKVVWNQKSHIKKGSKGNEKHITIYNPRDQWTITDGLHPAIIDKELFDRVQEIIAGRYRPSRQDGTVKSPMAGLVYCGNCGGKMQKMLGRTKLPYLMCQRPGCCAGTKYELVEQRLLLHLREILEQLTSARGASSLPPGTDWKTVLTEVRRERAAAEGQKNRLYELLELGEYDLPTFRERMPVVKDKIAALEAREEELLAAMGAEARQDPAAQAEKIAAVLAAYDDSDAAHRNALLHSVVERVTYWKEKKTKPTDFRLDVQIKPN